MIWFLKCSSVDFGIYRQFFTCDHLRGLNCQGHCTTLLYKHKGKIFGDRRELLKRTTIGKSELKYRSSANFNLIWEICWLSVAKRLFSFWFPDDVFFPFSKTSTISQHFFANKKSNASFLLFRIHESLFFFFTQRRR